MIGLFVILMLGPVELKNCRDLAVIEVLDATQQPDSWSRTPERGVTNQLTISLNQRIHNQLGQSFDLVERELLDKIMEEQKLRRDGRLVQAEGEVAAALKQLVGAHWFFTATIVENAHQRKEVKIRNNKIITHIYRMTVAFRIVGTRKGRVFLSGQETVERKQFGLDRGDQEAFFLEDMLQEVSTMIYTRVTRSLNEKQDAGIDPCDQF